MTFKTTTAALVQVDRPNLIKLFTIEIVVSHVCAKLLALGKLCTHPVRKQDTTSNYPDTTMIYSSLPGSTKRKQVGATGLSQDNTLRRWCYYLQRWKMRIVLAI